MEVRREGTCDPSSIRCYYNQGYSLIHAVLNGTKTLGVSTPATRELNRTLCEGCNRQ